MFETALKKGELITSIEFAIPEKSHYFKHPNPASRYAMVGVYVAKHKKEVNVAITGAQSSVYRDKTIEKALTEKFSPEALSEISIDSGELNSDIHASAEYRASLIISSAKKAVEASK
jgi:carbon-monoxide dehydrogenase medium subunit